MDEQNVPLARFVIAIKLVLVVVLASAYLAAGQRSARHSKPDQSASPSSVSEAARAARKIPQIASAKSVGVVCNLSSAPSGDQGPCKVILASLRAETPYKIFRCVAVAGGALGIVCPEGRQPDLQVALATVRPPGVSVYNSTILLTLGWAGQAAGSDVPSFVCHPPKGGDVIDAVQCAASKLTRFLQAHGMKSAASSASSAKP